MTDQKIIDLEKLSILVNQYKKKGKKVVLCHGVFDLLHIGHIKHFIEAKNLGDILVVSLTPDIHVNKGPGRPAFKEQLRLQAIAALHMVNYVVLNSTATAVNVIKKIKPNIYCKGKDYKDHQKDVSGQIKNETDAVKKIGGKRVFTKDIAFSSSKLINSYGNFQSNIQKLLIKKIKKNYTFLKIKNLIDQFKKIRVLIVGETIIDQYIFCDTLGKSGKDPMLVLREIKKEEYLGGASAIARHLSPFCNNISLLSMVGEKGENLPEIKKKLPKNINFKYIKKEKSPTIIKRRFLDHVSNNKVLGVYTINDDILSNKQDKLFYDILKKMLGKYDLVIVSDYGHGLISNKTASLICKNSKYLAVNAQVNSANIGYHSMRNYKNVDCVIVNEKEIQHEMRDRNNKTEFLMKKISQQQKIKNMIVTRGKEGALMYNRKSKKLNLCAAFADSAVDKIGAGDAMLSIISLCLKNNFSNELALLVGSLAAAQSTESIGNKNPVSKIKILKTLESLLK